MKLVFATHNKHKLSEIRDMLRDKTELLGLDDIGCHEPIIEDRDTLEGNASLKSFYIYNKYNINCFADDTGLEVETLGGRPGVHSARYSGNDSSNDTERSESNMQKLLYEMKGKLNRRARFRTVISYVEDGKEMLFEGIVNGVLLESKRGAQGFGYDPIFVPDGFTTTFAEMSMQEKSTISHRARAVKKLVDYLHSK